MHTIEQKDRITLGLLGVGVAIPFLYYGVQLAAAPFFPGFSLLVNTASELGSDRSTHPSIFNDGVLITGIALLCGSIGILLALKTLGTNMILAGFACIVVAITGLATLWAGLFPLPDPRHAGHPALLIAMLAVPFAMTAALWKLGISAPLKAYFLATFVLLALMVPVMSGMTGIDMAAYRGICQRVFALTVFPPIGVAAQVLGSRIKVGQPTP
jgi:glucan biosynthesis protein C